MVELPSRRVVWDVMDSLHNEWTGSFINEGDALVEAQKLNYLDEYAVKGGVDVSIRDGTGDHSVGRSGDS